jgi:hypothetical protein
MAGLVDRYLNPSAALGLGPVRTNVVGLLGFVTLTVCAALSGWQVLLLWLGFCLAFVGWPLFELRRAIKGYSWLYRPLAVEKAKLVAAAPEIYGLDAEEGAVLSYLVESPSQLGNEYDISFLLSQDSAGASERYDTRARLAAARTPVVAGSVERYDAAQRLVAKGLIDLKNHVFSLNLRQLAKLAGTRV